MISNEYSVMTNDNGDEMKILPNVIFNSIPSGFKMHSTVTVLSNDKTQRIATLNAGDITTQIPALPKRAIAPKRVLTPKKAVIPEGD